MELKLRDDLICLAKLFKNKATLYVVGGYVRNLLLNKEPKDIDLTSSLTIDEVKKVLENTKYKVKTVNKNYRTAKIVFNNNVYEYTTFRKDFYCLGNHFPEKTIFIKSLKDDCLRRDFTINSIYYDILKNLIVDPLNGVNDLKKHLIVANGLDTLCFDGERILRMVKYVCLLNLKIESKTFKMAKQNSKNVYCLSKNMLDSYRNLFKSLPLFKRIRAKRLLKNLNLEKLFFRLGD